MKIHHLLDGFDIAITNEEQSFVDSHPDQTPLSSLVGRDVIVAHNLVRKNVYKLTNDSKHIVINKGHDTRRSVI